MHEMRNPRHVDMRLLGEMLLRLDRRIGQAVRQPEHGALLDKAEVRQEQAKSQEVGGRMTFFSFTRSTDMHSLSVDSAPAASVDVAVRQNGMAMRVKEAA